MQTLVSSLPLALLFLVPIRAQDAPDPKAPESKDATPIVRPVVGQPAPEPALATWLDAEPSEKGVTKKFSSSSGGMIPSSRKAKTLHELEDHVVIVHTFAWSDGAAKDKALPLVRDLVAANTDRRLAAIGIGDGLELDAAKSAAKSAGLTYPVAIEKLAESKSPYVDLAAHPACFAFVVGRGGGLIWQGNPATDEKGFLNAVKDALALHPMLPIEHRLHDKLGKALAEYYGGKLSRAFALAQDEEKAAQKSGDKAHLDDAKYLQARAKEAQLEWLRELGEAATKKDATDYVALVRACKIGFARGEVQKDLDKLDKDAHKDGFFEGRMLESQKYLEMLDDRPVLFPARKDSAGDKFASKLEAFARSTPNSTEETRTAKELADRYRLTAR